MGTEFLKIMESNEANIIISELFEKYYVSKSIEVKTCDALGEVLFEDIFSKIDFPPFNKALKDGFAVKSEDTFKASEEYPNTLKIIDFLEAGDLTDTVVEKGCCIEICTGAAMPEGADAVVMVEYSEKNGDSVDIFKSATPNLDVALKGSDIRENEIIFKKGEVLTPAKLGVLLSQGYETVKVYKKPSVGVISTGNELIAQNEELTQGKIYDVNGNMIKNNLIANGCDAKFLGIVSDNYDLLKSKVSNSLSDVDVLICSGGTSAGLGDMIKMVLEELGEVYIHGISVQPGKPTIVGVISDKILIALPGNPVSALMICETFVIPHLSKLAGRKLKTNKVISGKLASRIHSPVGRMQYQLVHVDGADVHPIFKDSGAIFSLASADGYIKVLKNIELLDEGEKVKVYLFN